MAKKYGPVNESKTEKGLLHYYGTKVIELIINGVSIRSKNVFDIISELNTAWTNHFSVLSLNKKYYSAAKELGQIIT